MPGDTVKLGGQDFKKSHVMIGVAGVVGVAGLYYMRQRSAASAVPASNASSSAGTDAAGYPIGSADDLAYQAQQNDMYASGDYGSSVSGNGSIIGYDSAGNPVYGNGGVAGTPLGPGNYTSNAQWAQAYEQQVGSSGDDAIAAALGKYLTGQAMTADQVTTVQEAIAAQGYPPVGGPSGDPPGFKTASTGGTTGTGGQVNGVVSGLRAVAQGPSTALLSWNSTPGASSYKVTGVDYRGNQGPSMEVGGTSAQMSGLKPNTTYEFDVQAQPPKNGAHGAVYVTTKK